VLVAWFMALAILGLSVVPLAASAIRHGTLVDGDDAMRLVQMREWMDGKGWYDLRQTRVDPPRGLASHWPRLIELPMAGAIRAAELFVDRDRAERIVIAVWPAFLVAVLVLGMLVLAAPVFSPPTLLAGAAIIALNPQFLFQLLPGRIDHHGVQMVLVLLFAGATIAAFAAASRRAAVGAGLAAALSMAIGLEALPIIAAAAILFGGAWIVRGNALRRVVGAFGAAFALATPLLFAATIAPAHWSFAACDALSPPWLWLACGGGLALVGLAMIKPPHSVARRTLCALLAGGGVTAVFVIGWPHCLGGPLVDTDPLVRSLWLSGVGEARPTYILALHEPAQFLFFLAFPLVGVVALAVAAWRERNRRAYFLPLFVFALSALVIAVPAMRGVPFAAIFALFGWLYMMDRALRWRTPQGAAPSWTGAALALLVIAALPFGWDAIGKAAEAESPPATVETVPGDCGARADMASLAAEPGGLVLAPPRLGPRILVATGHDVLGAPYHRNNDGNLAAFNMLLAAPAEAHALIRRRGVDYVAVCLGDPDLPRLLDAQSGSLLHGLMEESRLPWLRPLPAKGPIRAWKVAG
jgi:hypothetical protein